MSNKEIPNSDKEIIGMLINRIDQLENDVKYLKEIIAELDPQKYELAKIKHNLKYSTINKVADLVKEGKVDISRINHKTNLEELLEENIN